MECVVTSLGRGPVRAIFVTLAAGFLFRLHVMKMSDAIRLGVRAWAGNITAAPRSIRKEARSRLPVPDTTAPHALGNILPGARGPVIVTLTN